MSINIDWSAAESEEWPWDDGHTPECLQSADNDHAPPQQYLRYYPAHHSAAFVHTVDEAASPALAAAIYRHTIMTTTTKSSSS